MTSKWDYGNAFERHPIQEGQVAVFSNGSRIAPHNIFDPLPLYMYSADILFVDPPWNKGNLNTFYTKAGRTDYQESFEVFYQRLFSCIAEIHPNTCYIEVGKEYLAEFLIEAKQLYKYVTFYNSTYYHKKNNRCYIIRAAHGRKKYQLDDMDEEDSIAWVCEHEEYSCIGDLCMGLGLVGVHAHANHRKFVGTELNPKRISVMLEKIAIMGGSYMLEEVGEQLELGVDPRTGIGKQ